MTMSWKQFLRALLKSLGRAPTPMPAPPPAPVPPPPTPTPAPGDVPAELLAAHNARRAEAGLPPLVPSVKLQAAARGHADLMARRGLMEHQLPGEPDLGARLRDVGYGWTWVGENIAWNYQTVPEVMTGWMASPGHRANILAGHYTQAGFAVARGADGSFWWSVDFGAPAIRTAYAIEPLTYAMGSPEVTGDSRVAASSIQVIMG
jgi:uncharacterized protein YkwD